MPRASGHLWLVGMPGAGKTTVGRLLAERLGRRFVDVDERIEEAAGRGVSEIFGRDGEAAFRALEAAMVRELAAQPGEAVIATGGGAPCTGDSLRLMQESGLVVWLQIDADEALARLAPGTRPLLAGDEPRARWLSLEAQRRAVYARAALRIAGAGRTPTEIADEVGHRLDEQGGDPVRRVTVELGDRSYPILIDEGPGAPERFALRLAERQPPSRAKIGLVTDENVARIHGARFLEALRQGGYRGVQVVVPAGEPSKSLARVEQVAERLAAGGLDRRSAIVALGGGVVGDLAGFVASTLFRGIGFVQAPTTLLAMVDASVGGKTGVNLEAGKNLVGSFHQPLLVYAALETLSTLPERDLSSGLAEVVKHALLEGGAAWDRLLAVAERARAGDPRTLAELVAASCRLKARIVAEDERELDQAGGRALLNLGHTVGHALEADGHRRARRGRVEPLRHGEAVALGLLAAARIGARLATAGEADADLPDLPDLPDFEDRLATLLRRLGLPTDLDARLSAPDALGPLAVDKKRASGLIRFVALFAPGAVRLVPIEPDRLVGLLQRVQPLTDPPGPSSEESRC